MLHAARKTTMTDHPTLSAAQQKWPNVPACYGWLSLDRRGDWRLQDERVSHRGLIAFLNQNYRCDAHGRWFVQNGPQQVFVRLSGTPWVFRMQPDGPVAHTGQVAGAIREVWLDDGGSVLLRTDLGSGLLDDRDLAAFLTKLTDASGALADDEALISVMNGQSDSVFWQGLPVQAIAAVNLENCLKFVANPQP